MRVELAHADPKELVDARAWRLAEHLVRAEALQEQARAAVTAMLAAALSELRRDLDHPPRTDDPVESVLQARALLDRAGLLGASRAAEAKRTSFTRTWAVVYGAVARDRS